MPEDKIEVWGDAPEGQVKIEVHSERMDCDYAMFTFTDEGVIIDMVKDDEIVGTTSQMWEEVEEELVNE